MKIAELVDLYISFLLLSFFLLIHIIALRRDKDKMYVKQMWLQKKAVFSL